MAQKKKKSVTTCVFAFALVVATTPARGVKTSCGMETIGQSGLFYCKFGENIRETQKGFVVQRYDLTSNSTTPVAEVLQCNWLPKGLKCPVTQAGYEFDKTKVSDILFLKIVILTPDYEGRYLCQVIGNDDSDDKICTYTYAGAPVEKSTTSSPPTTTEVYTVDKIQHSDDNSLAWGIGLSVVLGVLVLAVSVVLYCLWKRAGTPRDNTNDQENGDCPRKSLLENEAGTNKSPTDNTNDQENGDSSRKSLLESEGLKNMIENAVEAQLQTADRTTAQAAIDDYFDALLQHLKSRPDSTLPSDGKYDQLRDVLEDKIMEMVKAAVEEYGKKMRHLRGEPTLKMICGITNEEQQSALPPTPTDVEDCEERLKALSE